MIDVDRLKTSVDLLALAGRDTTLRRVAGTGGGEYAGPCPFCGGRDRFRVQPEGGRWLCRGCTGGKWADALAYVARRESLDLRSGPDFRRACELLGAVDSFPARPFGFAQDRPRPLKERAPPEPHRSGPPPAEWQARARQVVETCERNLWGADGERARKWLHRRGLSDDTLRRWRIGYHPAHGAQRMGSEIAGLFVPFGIVIPCEIDGVIWYLKVRRATGEPKYLHVKGGRPALFGAETLAGRDVVVICEGEFDALLLAQECGDLCGVATLGSATGRLDLSAWGAYLLPVARLLVAFDLDGAGRDGAQQLAGMTARARRVSVPRVNPGDKDLTDFWKAGGRLRDWLTFEIARLDLPAYGAQPAHMGSGETAGHGAHVPISQQSAEVEESWWARVFAERGIPDPAYGAQSVLPCLTNGEQIRDGAHLAHRIAREKRGAHG